MSSDEFSDKDICSQELYDRVYKKEKELKIQKERRTGKFVMDKNSRTTNQPRVK